MNVRHGAIGMAFLATVLFVPAGATEALVRPAAPLQPPAPGDWPEYRYDDGRSGVNPSETILSPSTVPGLQKLWEFGANLHYDPRPPSLQSSPAISDGLVFIGSNDSDRVFALEASGPRAGRKAWSFRTGGHVPSSPAVAAGIVYVGCLDGVVYALRASTGEELWRFQTGGPVYSSPAVAGGIVYIGSDDGYVYALRASTGRRKWRFDAGGPVRSSPAVAGRTVYVAAEAHDGQLFAIDTWAGKERWSAPGGWDATPTVVGGVVYVASGQLRALDARTGAEIWTYSTNEGLFGQAVAGETVYVVSGDYIIAVDAQAGQELWRSGFSDSWFKMCALTAANGVVYVGSQDHFLYALDAATGGVLWHTKVVKYVHSSPAVANGVLYLGVAGKVYAFGLPD